MTSKRAAPAVRAKRIHEPAEAQDGARVLVDRIWPRGISKARAALDAWCPEVAPSTELRKWFGHDARRWEEFQRRYEAELEGNDRFDALVEDARGRTVTLLYSARDTEHNQAVALAGFVERRLRG
jgi:uncharacterized protein YeaO (DUF488 family)